MPAQGVVRVRSKDVIIGRDRICEHYDIGRKKLQSMIDAGLPVVRIGNAMAVSTRQVAEFIQRMAERGGRS